VRNPFRNERCGSARSTTPSGKALAERRETRNQKLETRSRKLEVRKRIERRQPARMERWRGVCRSSRSACCVRNDLRRGGREAGEYLGDSMG